MRRIPLPRAAAAGFRRRSIRSSAALLLAVLAFILANVPRSAAHSADPATAPNIVLILADDLGYGDLGCYGNFDVKTPHLDRFATQGLRLTSCYAGHANCSPSRTALMTGRTPFRAGIHNWIPFNSPMHLRRSEVTVASLLKESGYATCHVGKWHLNGRFNQPQQPQPSDHGFEHWFSTQNNALPCHHNPENFVRNGQPAGELEGYSGQIVADEAARWLRDGRDRSKPFFLYVCFHEPHEPIASDHRFARMYPPIGPPSPYDPSVTTYQAHHGNISQLDDAFGRLMKTLDDLGLADGTLVFFTSDNGPAITRDHPHGSTGPLRAYKGHMYEGGLRVPGIVRWPGRVKPGRTSDEPVCGVDVFPTLCEVAGTAVPAGRTLDGASFLPALEGRPIERRTPLYWHFTQASSAPKVAMRDGDWKLLARLTGPEVRQAGDVTDAAMKSIKSAELGTFELYNLREDVAERVDLAAKEPERVEKMADRLRTLYREVREETPVWPAWEFERVEGKRIQEFRRAQIEAVGPVETRQATGVKVGEVTGTSAIVWMRLTARRRRNDQGVVRRGRPAGPLPDDVKVSALEGDCPGAAGRVRLRYGTRDDLSDAVVTQWAEVDAETDFTHQFRLDRLRPGTTYSYSAETAALGGTPVHGALRGQFETAPPPDERADVAFTVVTGQAYKDVDHLEGFHIYESMLSVRPKFLVPTGDTVYYDSEDPRATTVELARHHWRRMYGYPRHTAFHLRVPGYWEKDDHDTLSDDCWPTLRPRFMLPMTFEDGLRIFREQVPMGEKTYRTVRWGKSLEIWLVEGRDFRSPNTMPDGPDKTIWGAEQKRWLKESLLASDADWRVLVSPTPIVGPDRPRGKNDNHSNAAFRTEGDEMRRWFRDNLKGNFFLVCGDRHWQYHSVHPETKLDEFSCGPASDEHAGGSPGLDEEYHRFHRVKGGFLSVTVTKAEPKSRIAFRLHDVRGKVQYEYAAP